MNKYRADSRWRMVGNWATAWRAWGMQIRWKRRRTHKEGNMRKAHLGIRMSRVNAIRFSQWFTEAKERGNSARRKKKDWPCRQWAAIGLNLWHVSLSLELLMYIYMFSKLKCFHGFKSITHTFECKKDDFPSVGRRYKKERPKPLFM